MKDDTTTMPATLPASVRMPINRCNLPAVILGGLAFQRHPVSIRIDGVNELHQQLFRGLDRLEDAAERAANFMDYMRSAFLLDYPEQAGSDTGQKRYRREKMDYLRLLRGWFFNPDGLEAAVMKGWVESRFGLLVRNHHGPLRDYDSERYRRFQHERSTGLYNSNALESQLDLLYGFCQYELTRQNPQLSHFVLYRGSNDISQYEQLSQDASLLLLNNLNSFTSDRERADEFGDRIIEGEIPLAKLLYFPALLPAIPQSELEYLVIGGVYQVSIQRF